MFSSDETKSVTVNVLKTVLKELSLQNNIPTSELFLRIDLESDNAKPIFALFQKEKFLRRTELKEIIRAGGGFGFHLILGMHIRDIIKRIFIEIKNRFELSSTKDIFILIYLDNDEPFLAFYISGQLIEAKPLEVLLSEEN